MVSFAELELRNYLSKDAAAMRDIYAHYVKNSVISFDLDVPDLAHMKEKFREIFRARRPIIVATFDDQVIGYAYASTYRTRPAYRFTCEHAIYMHPSFMGQGHGTALFAELIKRSTQFGYNQMIAIITKGTAEHAAATEGSIALHKKFGFEVLGEFPELGYKFDTWHNVIHMQKKL